MRFFVRISFVVLLTACSSVKEPDVFLMEGDVWAEIKKTAPPEARILKQLADEKLQEGPYSVTFKKSPPPSGDMHDYISQGPYWWPDPETKDGLPYIRRDGEKNPEHDDFSDPEQFKGMMDAIRLLSQAYYVSGEERYARHAAMLIRVFFLDPETRMNPHLKYAQQIPGRTEGRGIGIIDTRTFTYLPDAVGMIRPSASWRREDEESLKQWLTAYLDWLLTSKHGRESYANGNNHTSWFYSQTIALSLFTGRQEVADSLARTALPAMLDAQLNADGSQPHELARTRSWSYSTMNLVALFNYARLCEHVELDIWTEKNEAGAGLQDALDFLLPYASSGVPWPHEQIGTMSMENLKHCLNVAALKYGNTSYKEAARSLSSTGFDYLDLCDKQP